MKQDWTNDNHLIEVLNEKRDVISTAMVGFARNYIVSNNPFVYEPTNAIKADYAEVNLMRYLVGLCDLYIEVRNTMLFLI